MATVAHGAPVPIGDGLQNVVKVTWPLTTTNDTGSALDPAFVQHVDLCWQAVGANWGGATLTIQGSNDGTNWFDCRDAGSSSLTFTANGGKQMLERPVYVRPKLTTAGTAADVSVILCARRNQRTKR